MARRIAANRVIIDDRQLIQYIVEIENGIVTNYYPLTEEQPFTEWLGGTILLTKDANGIIRASKDGKFIE